jgi:hypothetical protein
VTVLKGMESTAVLAKAACAHGADIVRLGGLLTPFRGGNVVPVHRGDVVPVGTVLSLQLPVAFVDIGRGAAQHLETLRRLVNDQVDDLGGLAEMRGERRRVGVRAAEQETAVGFGRIQSGRLLSDRASPPC